MLLEEHVKFRYHAYGIRSPAHINYPLLEAKYVIIPQEDQVLAKTCHAD